MCVWGGRGWKGVKGDYGVNTWVSKLMVRLQTHFKKLFSFQVHSAYYFFLSQTSNPIQSLKSERAALNCLAKSIHNPWGKCSRRKQANHTTLKIDSALSSWQKHHGHESSSQTTADSQRTFKSIPYSCAQEHFLSLMFTHTSNGWWGRSIGIASDWRFYDISDPSSNPVRSTRKFVSPPPPKSKMLCWLAVVATNPHVYVCMYTHAWSYTHIKRSCSPHQSSVDYGNMKRPSTHFTDRRINVLLHSKFTQ